jgi:DNA-binding NarL/FixJ family response regulator
MMAQSDDTAIPRSSSTPSGSATILLAEDHAANRALLHRRLERAGYRVLSAADGVEAVAMVLEHRPAVVIMDLAMPKLDGIEAWRQIKARSAEPPVCIALTAADIQDVRASCEAVGFHEFIVKPFNFSKLVATIDRFAPTLRNRSSDSSDEEESDHPSGLTTRQLQCIILAARGKSDWEIGEVLNISKETAHKHVQTAMKRLGVVSRTQLAVRALYDSLIEFSDIIE